MMNSVHICGAGGIGTSGVALVLQSLGCHVTATDACTSEITALLARLGVPVETKPRPDWAKSAECVIAPNAFPQDHPELVAAKEAGVPVMTRTEALLRLCAEHAASTTICIGTTARARTAALIAANRPDAGYCLGLAPKGFVTHAKFAKDMVLDLDERELLEHVDLLSALKCATLLVSDMAEQPLGYYAKNWSFQACLEACAPRVDRVVYPQFGENNKLEFWSGIGPQAQRLTAFDLELTAQQARLVSPDSVDTLAAAPLPDLSAFAAARTLLGAQTQINDVTSVGWFEKVDERRVFDIRMHPVNIQNAIRAMKACYPNEALTVVIRPFASTHARYDMNTWRKAFAGAQEVIVVTPGYQVPDKACRQLATAFKMRGLAASVQPRKQVYADFTPTGEHQLWIGAPELMKP